MRIEGIVPVEKIQETSSPARPLKRQSEEFPNAAPERKDDPENSSEEVLDKIVGLTEGGLYSVRFERNDSTGQTVIRVVDRDSGEVIRQLPPEELLDVSRTLEDLRGLILDTEG